MTTEKTYNGWTNYETWNVALWIDNDHGSYSYWRGVMQEIYDDETDEDDSHTERIDEAAIMLADRLKDEINEGAPDLGASCYSDLLGAALSEVNWDEIARNWLDEIDEPEADE